MELPKHTTQVGTIAANKKLYLEDYCISYMKQLTEEFPEERKQIALFGIVEKDKNVEYVQVYAAALLGKGRGRTDSLTNSQKAAAESIREEYFSDYQLVGVVISTDAVNENVYWLGNGNKSIPMDGYYIFYDKNDAMLNFMMQNQKEERDIDLDPVIIKKADMDNRKREKAEQEMREAQQKRGQYRKEMKKAEAKGRAVKQKTKSPFPAVACLLLLAVVGVYGAKTYYPEFELSEAKRYISDLWDKTAVLTGSYLDKDVDAGKVDELLQAENNASAENAFVENATTESAAAGSEIIEGATMETAVSGTVELPSELGVVVIPDPDTLESAAQPGQNVTENKPEGTGSGESVNQEIPVQSESVAEEYLIKRGDNLLRILRSHYGNEAKLQEICDLNNIVDPNNIQVGQTILLP